MFAYEPIGGYHDERDAVALPWDRWQEEAGTRGGDIVSLFAVAPGDHPPPTNDGP